MQRATFVEHLVIAVSVLQSGEAQVNDRITDVQIADVNLRKPVGQMRIDEQEIQASIEQFIN